MKHLCRPSRFCQFHPGDAFEPRRVGRLRGAREGGEHNGYRDTCTGLHGEGQVAHVALQDRRVNAQVLSVSRTCAGQQRVGHAAEGMRGSRRLRG